MVYKIISGSIWSCRWIIFAEAQRKPEQGRLGIFAEMQEIWRLLSLEEYYMVQNVTIYCALKYS